MKNPILKSLRGLVEKWIHQVEPRPVLPNELFPWAKEIEKAYPLIRKEAELVLSQREQITNFDSVLPGQRALYQKDSWKSFFLVGKSEPIPEHQKLCPETTKALKNVPGIINAFFSILSPGLHIPAHRGPYSGLLRYHLGVIIPEGDVAIRVDQEICRWRNGESLFFDDSFDHEVWNRTNETRVILFVDLARPLPFPLSVINHFILWLFKRSKLANEAQDYVLNNQIKREPI